MAKYQTKCFTNAKPMVLPTEAYPEFSAVDVEFNTANYALNDLIEICTIPAGYKCLDFSVIFPDIDTGNVLAFSIGVENAGGTDIGAEVWQTGILAGGVNTITRNTTSICAQGVTNTDRNIVLKVTTAATGYTGATKVGQVLLTLQG